MEAESKRSMEPKRIARLLGAVLSIAIVLAILLLNAYGVVRLSDSVVQLWFLVLGVLVTIAFQLIIFPERFLPLSRSRSEGMVLPPHPGPSEPKVDSNSLEKGLIRQSELEKVTADLDAHHKGVIERMEQWDYLPREGEMISVKGVLYGLLQNNPPNLDQDKAHLKGFDEAWSIYSKGPGMYAEASRSGQSARWLVNQFLASPLNEVEPPCRLVEKFTTDIIDRVDSRNRGLSARDFEATMMKVQTSGNLAVEYPAIDTEVLDALMGPPESRKWTLDRARKLAELMNKVLASEDLAGFVRKNRQAWDVVLKNKNDFLTALREKVIAPATNSNYQDPELSRAVCNDCCYLKAKRDLLLRV
jgi:hypothetical protein